jgi:protein tyrosine/serine phosphatase
MQERFSNFVAVAGVLIYFASTGVAQSELKYQELPNFHQVNQQLYRGAQPKRGGIQRLAQLGVKTIVSLRARDVRSQMEEREAQAAGLRYINVPFERLGRPTDEQVVRVMSIISSPENQPVFVHCQRGADRTGAVIAVYRIEYDNWTSEKAKAEAKRYGMKPWQLGMKDYIRDYYLCRSLRTLTALAPSVVY